MILISVIDYRIADGEYLSQYICQTLFKRLILNNPDKDVYSRINGNISSEYIQKLCNSNILTISMISLILYAQKKSTQK